MLYDVVIIGAGVSGSAIARELSRYKLQICVLEKEEDVCCGTTKANSAIVHAGFDAETGSMMAKLNVRGSQMMDQIASDLDVPFRRNGALVVCTDPDEVDGLQKLYDRGIANGLPADSMEILNREEVLALEPNLSENVVGAFYAKTSGIVCPFLLNIAMAENANVNGVDFFFNTEVEHIEEDTLPSSGEKIWRIRTCNGDYKARYIINAAGVYADVFHNMVSAKKIHITPRRGAYCLLDRAAGNYVSHTVFSLPGKMGKGVLVTPTIHGNLLIGPNAQDIENREGTNTTAEGLQEIIEKAGRNVRNLPMYQVITSFAGLRAHEDGHDFIIGEVEDAPRFIDCAGIESPGLSSSPAIGEYVAKMMAEKLHLTPKENWNGKRKGILRPSELSMEERNALIREKPAYGRIICRCESITEGEILDAIHRPLGARSLDGVKRRTRAGMGRCQAGFCSPRTMEILHRELGIPYEKITKSGGDSKLVTGRTKEHFGEEA
ncbi:MAG: NAD(P)/FAD-dependent oxidoreductase [Eubacterium sp.]|nr:NAD(P)/FAD-dependent oxidoreductase [Eubacterium sp.]